MATILSIDFRATQIPDSVRKLQFLRREIGRRKIFPSQAQRLPATTILATVIAALTFVATSTGMSQHKVAVAPTFSLRASPSPTLTTIPTPAENIWLVEKTKAYWVYSNGLQIRADYLTQSTLRHYKTWSRKDLTEESGESSFPAGIVFHTTESLLLPLEPGQAHSLVRTRENVLDHIRRGRLYNYVIDRFGQVFRVVPDDQVAFHAGHSVWADDQHVYEGLNDSFLGVAFEARTHESFIPDEAQIHSGRMLTDFLLTQYLMPASNCVTHAQVSINPSNRQIGYHTDWAANFPFRQFGLPDGYSTPLPAIELFGFEYNQFFLEAIGGTPWGGLLTAEALLQRAADAHHTPAPQYRNLLQRKYHAIRSQNHEPADRDRT